MTMRPDPTFHASPKLAMEASPESFAYMSLSKIRSGSIDGVAQLESEL
jgi:selenium-binding protein 1